MESFLRYIDVTTNYYFIIGGFFLSYLIYRIVHSFLSGDNFIQTIYSRGRYGHTWRSIECNKSLPYNIYCTVCSKLMLPVVGLFCECCAISACKNCNRILNKKFKCKPISWPRDKPFYHHWVDIGTSEKENTPNKNLKRLFCCWCQRTKVIRDDLINDIEECDFNKYKKLIIPPTCVHLYKGNIKHINPPNVEDWEPVIILANKKSGSSRCDEVISIFRGLLNPIQVIDISSISPEKVLKWIPGKCRVLIAGGDGTVAWVLNTLRPARHIDASVGILPMGTGNDLSRVLGWGAGCDARLDAHAILKAVRDAELQPLDRWKITIKPKRAGLRGRGERVLYAYNYASLGVDAQVALDFHRARAQFLYRFANRTLNYMAYLFLGMGRALDDGGCGGLERRLRVWAGVHRGALRLPPLQALVALNIPSWGAGVNLWEIGNVGNMPDQNINDGRIEVVGISSSFHIARLQVGLAEPYRFAQTSRLLIELSGSCAMQVDGEPWMQSAATISIEQAGRCRMLRAPHCYTETG